MVVLPELDSQLNDNPDANGDEAHCSNVGHNLSPHLFFDHAGFDLEVIQTSLC